MEVVEFFSDDVHFPFEEVNERNEWIAHCLTEEGCEEAQITVIFCSDDKLLEINKQFLKHDFYTDVITFPLAENPLEGEIYISTDRVKENASDFQASFIDELDRVIIHGVLHLLSYNDKSEEETELMRSKEDYYLNLRGFNVPRET